MAWNGSEQDQGLQTGIMQLWDASTPQPSKNKPSIYPSYRGTQTGWRTPQSGNLGMLTHGCYWMKGPFTVMMFLSTPHSSLLVCRGHGGRTSKATPMSYVLDSPGGGSKYDGGLLPSSGHSFVFT